MKTTNNTSGEKPAGEWKAKYTLKILNQSNQITPTFILDDDNVSFWEVVKDRFLYFILPSLIYAFVITLFIFGLRILLI